MHSQPIRSGFSTHLTAICTASQSGVASLLTTVHMLYDRCRITNLFDTLYSDRVNIYHVNINEYLKCLEAVYDIYIYIFFVLFMVMIMLNFITDSAEIKRTKESVEEPSMYLLSPDG